jgi:hypothetical protein
VVFVHPAKASRRVERYGNPSCEQRAEERVEENGRCGEHERHSFARPKTQPLQRARDSPGACKELAVRKALPTRLALIKESHAPRMLRRAR